MLPTPHIHQLSETAWLIQFHTGLAVAANKAIHQLASWFAQNPMHGQSELIPAYDSLLICFSNVTQLAHSKLNELIQKEVIQALASIEVTLDFSNSQTIDIPVFYNTNAGSDLDAMSQNTGMTVKEIIQVHSSPTYHVYMLGFLPGFCYLGEVDSRIAMPRKNLPAPVKAGAVGIAGVQTGIYPLNSPGGWHILGHTPLKMFDAFRNPSTLVQPGMQVKFVPIPLSDYQSLLQL